MLCKGVAEDNLQECKSFNIIGADSSLTLSLSLSILHAWHDRAQVGVLKEAKEMK